MTDLQIRCFLEVSKSLNFSSAARKLFISQSNISRQIAMFEEELGFQLFTRTTKTVKLTTAGEILAEKLVVLLEEWEEVLEEAKNTSQRIAGRLAIGCTVHNKTNSYLSRMLADYNVDHNGVQIVKERNTQKKLIEGLMSGYYDAILIANHDVCRLTSVDSISLFQTQVGIAIHRKNSIFKQEHVTLKDFASFDFLRYKPTDIPLEEDYMYQLCLAHGFEPKVKEEYEDFEDFLFAIESGEGVAIIYEEDEISSNKNLRFIRIEEESPHKYLPMKLTRKQSNKNRALDELFRFAKIWAKYEAKSEEMMKK